MAPGGHVRERSPSPELTCKSCKRTGTGSKDRFYTRDCCTKECFDKMAKPAYGGGRDNRGRGRDDRGRGRDDRGRGARERRSRSRSRRERSGSRDRSRRHDRRSPSNSPSPSPAKKSASASPAKSRSASRSASSSPEARKPKKSSAFGDAPEGYVLQKDHHGNPTNIPK